jgi:hypothetical protein
LNQWFGFVWSFANFHLDYLMGFRLQFLARLLSFQTENFSQKLQSRTHHSNCQFSNKFSKVITFKVQTHNQSQSCEVNNLTKSNIISIVAIHQIYENLSTFFIKKIVNSSSWSNLLYGINFLMSFLSFFESFFGELLKKLYVLNRKFFFPKLHSYTPNLPNYSFLIPP